MTDERTVPIPEELKPGPNSARWAEPTSDCAGGWIDDDVLAKHLREEGRVVLDPNEEGVIEAVTGYVHKAEYMQLMWKVQELNLTVSRLVDTLDQFAEGLTDLKRRMRGFQPSSLITELHLRQQGDDDAA